MSGGNDTWVNKPCASPKNAHNSAPVREVPDTQTPNQSERAASAVEVARETRGNRGTRGAVDAVSSEMQQPMPRSRGTSTSDGFGGVYILAEMQMPGASRPHSRMRCLVLASEMRHSREQWAPRPVRPLIPAFGRRPTRSRIPVFCCRERLVPDKMRRVSLLCYAKLEVYVDGQYRDAS